MKSICNWRDAQSYPKPKSLSLGGWAWEFLRRNPDYQRAWDCYSERMDAIRKEKNSELRFHFDPPKQDRESFDDWIKRVGKHGRARNFAIVAAEEWGLDTRGLLDPFKDGEQLGLFWAVAPNAKWIGEFENGFPFANSHEALVIDYRLPIEPQLNAIRNHAISKQTALVECGVVELPQVKKLRSEWGMYLRILDAKLSGVDDKTITKELYGTDHYGVGHPNATKARKGIKTACYLRDDGYKWLPPSHKVRSNRDDDDVQFYKSMIQTLKTSEQGK